MNKTINKIKKIFLIASTVTILTACATGSFFGEKISQLNPGMSKVQVIDIIGRPDGFKNTNEGQVLKYNHRVMSGNSFLYSDYYLLFDKSNKLIAIENSGTVDKTKDFQNAVNSFNNNQLQQQQLRNQQNQQLINNLNNNRVQKIKICRSGELMCF